MKITPSAIADEIVAAEPRFAGVVQLVGPPPQRRPLASHKRFERLATAILHQQLAGRAAATITERTRVALGGAFEPAALLALDETTLRSCGVSGAKAAALKDLATRVEAGDLTLSSLGRQKDDEVIQQLTAVRGIGQWTAEMFLMGPLGRHDIWPVGDLGVRAGWAAVNGDRIAPPRQLLTAADHLRPWRSSVAWYCWQAVDLARANGGTLPK